MDLPSNYNLIAEGLQAICSRKFDEAKVEVEILDDWSKKSYKCKYQGEWSKGLSSPADIDFKLDDAFHEIRAQMTVPGQQPWSRCTFTLFPDGKFKFDVEYDD